MSTGPAAKRARSALTSIVTQPVPIDSAGSVEPAPTGEHRERAGHSHGHDHTTPLAFYSVSVPNAAPGAATIAVR